MALTFGEKIKEARKEKHLTQKQLADKIGAKHNSVSDWENNKNKPDPDTIELLCGVLGIAPNYLLSTPFDSFSPIEKKIIEKYRFISQHSPAGSKTVDFIIDREYEAAQQLQEKNRRIAELEACPIVVEKREGSILRMYSYIHKIACAGNGFYFEDIPTDTIEAPYREGADFIAGVNGDSMEPTFKDGDLVYVERRQIIDVGEIGLFILNNECFIKEAGEEGLISHNPKYDIIPGTDQIQCIGKVLGRVSEVK